MTGDGAVVRQDEARAYAERLIEQAAKLKVKPTIDELEAILNGPEPQIHMNPDGSYNADGDLLNSPRPCSSGGDRKADAAGNQFDCCMCGSPMDGHDIGPGHSPVSMCDYQLDQAEKRAEASEARTAGLLKALGKYGRHIDCPATPRKGFGLGDCTCGFAAAKGETV